MPVGKNHKGKISGYEGNSREKLWSMITVYDLGLCC